MNKLVNYLKDNALKFKLLSRLHYCDVYGSNYESNLKHKDLYNADMLINYAENYVPLKGLYRYYHAQTSNIKVMIGLPGSSKSTIIKNSGWDKDHCVISRDIIREKIGISKNGEKALGNLEQELLVTEIFDS